MSPSKSFKKILLFLLLFVLGTGEVFSQTFDKEALLRFAENQSKKKVLLSTQLPIIYESANLAAATAVNNNQLWSGGIAGLSLSGNGITLGYWDSNQPLLTHQEYSGRVTWEESSVGANNAHATQMVGTMVATGVDSDARGMANGALVEAWNWTDDISEMAISAAGGLLTSAHPYTEIAGWTTNSSICGSGWTWYTLPSVNSSKAYQFGYYDSQAQHWDSVAYMAPDYLIIKAAGNQRGTGPTTQPLTHYTLNDSFVCIEESVTREVNGGASGFETVNAASVAKNVLVVGAVQSSTGNFDDLSSVTPLSFSGFGPTDDGRIKPDIVAPGSGLYTSTSSSNSAYATSSQTSAATAVVTGSVALIREHYQSLYSDTLSSASLRALLAHTADDIGNEGPDYKTGWGLLNTERAVRFLSSQNSDPGLSVFKDTTLVDGNSISIEYDHTSERPLIITIAWTDPKGTSPITGDDPSDVILINDLDLEVTDPEMSVHQPWVLDRNNPDNAATFGDNDVDNIEQVYISNASAGTYTVTVSNEGSLQSGSQRVSILISETEPEVLVETIADGNWSEASTWNGGSVPSSSFYRGVIKHDVVLDQDISIRGLSFDGATAELGLNGNDISLYGGIYHSSGGLGFAGDTSSSLTINDWEMGSGALKFVTGSQYLSSLIIDINEDTVTLASDLELYTQLSLNSGFLNPANKALTLISNNSNTAYLEKSDGLILGDLKYSRFFSHSGSGWRVISSPFDSSMFSDLNDPFFTQAGSWADQSVSENESTYWLFNEDSQSFSGYAGNDTLFTPGHGYLFYIFDEEPSGNSILPGSMVFSGSEPDSVIIDLYRGVDDASSYNLVGNPFAGTIDWHEIVSDGTSLGSSYAVWDPLLTSGGGSAGFKYYSESSGLGDAGRYIPPMQGFFVQAIDNEAVLRFRQNQKSTNTPVKYGKANTAGQLSYLEFTLTKEGKVLDSQAKLIFHESGKEGSDPFDVLRLSSLSGLENNFSFLRSDGKKTVFEGRSTEGTVEVIKSSVELNDSGEYKLEWVNTVSIPDDWAVFIEDQHSGNRVDMRENSAIKFTYEAGDSLFFVIEVQKGVINNTENDNPIEFGLSQNYPNPFNPVTVISYQLAVNSDVSLKVFDMLGREVAVLVKEQKATGKYQVSFDASSLASGVYFYQLKAGAFIETRSMLLIK